MTQVTRDKGKPPVEEGAPARPQKRGGRRKPWSVEYETNWIHLWPGWHRGGSYETYNRARQAFEAQVKKSKRAYRGWNYRLVNPEGVAVQTFIHPCRTEPPTPERTP